MRTDPAGQPSSALARIGGEFLSHALESTYRWSRLSETLSHNRRLLIASALLNTVFLLSDWRFHGTPQFWIAIPARLAVVAISLACFGALRWCRSPGRLHGVMAIWVAVTALGVTALVSSHSEIALMVVLLLPIIFYLGVPLPFGWTVTGAVAASAGLLAGYETHDPAMGTGLGLGLAVATLNCCLALVLGRGNRLRRLEWQATRAARAIAEELAASQETLEKMFAAAPVPMVVTSRDQGRILHVNDACATMFGIVPGMIGSASFLPFYADPAERDRLLARLDADGRVSDFETQALCADEIQRTVLVKAAAIELAEGSVMIAGIIDISDRKAMELSLEWLASTDPLTKLPNRLSFFSTARGEMMRASRLNRPLALLMIDLDHFKAINDTFGHHGGDMALKAFGRICLDRLRGVDSVGRLGGEEFGVLLPDTDLAAAQVVAWQLCEDLAGLRLPAPHQALRLSASIGLTMLRPGDRTLDTALARADTALYVAKREGRGRVQSDTDDIIEGRRQIAH